MLDFNEKRVGNTMVTVCPDGLVHLDTMRGDVVTLSDPIADLQAIQRFVIAELFKLEVKGNE